MFALVSASALLRAAVLLVSLPAGLSLAAGATEDAVAKQRGTSIFSSSSSAGRHLRLVVRTQCYSVSVHLLLGLNSIMPYSTKPAEVSQQHYINNIQPLLCYC